MGQKFFEIAKSRRRKTAKRAEDLEMSKSMSNASNTNYSQTTCVTSAALKEKWRAWTTTNNMSNFPPTEFYGNSTTSLVEIRQLAQYPFRTFRVQNWQNKVGYQMHTIGVTPNALKAKTL